MTAEGQPHGGVEVQDGDGVTAVRFWGEVDVAVRTAGTAPLTSLRGGTSPMTVDCRDVDFMDSTGMSVLVRIMRDACADQRPVRFLGASEPVRLLLETTGADRWMTGLGVRTEA